MGCPLKGGGGLYSRMIVAAVLLAAGEGRRMGGVAKPAIALNGVPLSIVILLAVLIIIVLTMLIIVAHKKKD